MRTELTLMERREIARKTVPTKKVKNDKYDIIKLL